MNKILFTTVLMMMFVIVPTKQSFAGPESFIGEITIFAGNYAPRNFAFCEGQILEINSHQALFALLGARYGGDGIKTFALPNLKSAERDLNGARYIIALNGIFPSRQ